MMFGSNDFIISFSMYLTIYIIPKFLCKNKKNMLVWQNSDTLLAELNNIS